MQWNANQSADCLYFDTEYCVKRSSDHKKHEHTYAYHVLLAGRAERVGIVHKRVGSILTEARTRLVRTPGVSWALTLVSYVIGSAETAGDSIQFWHFFRRCYMFWFECTCEQYVPKMGLINDQTDWRILDQKKLNLCNPLKTVACSHGKEVTASTCQRKGVGTWEVIP